MSKGDVTLFGAVRKTLSESLDTVVEVSDQALGALTEGTVLEEIPFVSVGVKVLKARDAFVEARFRRNCHALLVAFRDNAPAVEREALFEKLDVDSNSEDFVDTLLQIAADGSKPLKGEIVGRLMAALARGDITYSVYDTLVHIVHAASISALKALPKFMAKPADTSNVDSPYEGEALLMSCGIGFRFGSRFSVTDLGQTLYRHGFGGAVAAP